ncbi:MAG: radical SAM protein [Pedosphaera sp.]|nr:radical SAM protein [Pedosphaera sp.]
MSRSSETARRTSGLRGFNRALKVNLRIRQFLARSRANGPGTRAVVWVQGCSLNCAGCFNPETHALDRGEIIRVEDLFQRIVAETNLIEGVTISGGEPLQQPGPVIELLRLIKENTLLSIILFTGFQTDEIAKLNQVNQAILCYVDVLIAGRYDQSRRVAQGLIGSSNKTLSFLTRRYHWTDLEAVPPAEIILTPEGEVIMSGIDPVRW